MNIRESLLENIRVHAWLNSSDQVLLAVSGGKDSMLMARLFKDLGYSCHIAHCNFRLRGLASDLDESLVRSYGEELGFPVHVRHFDTEAYAKDHGLSIQMAARELRYSWFEQIRLAEGLTYIAIAQHQNDHLETLLLNLTRGTGLAGLLGISAKRGRLLRPLLNFSAQEVSDAVSELEVPYRDDQSNFSTKYARNKIRLEIIPKFLEIQPDFEKVLHKNMQHFEESQSFIQRIVDQHRKDLFHLEGGHIRINRKSLSEHKDDLYLLFELFKPYGFSKSVLGDLAQVIDRPMGQLFVSSTHELLLDRESLLLRVLDSSVEAGPFFLKDLSKSIVLGSQELQFDQGVPFSPGSDTGRIQVDQDNLIFPLQVRTWVPGDSFVPFGMEGHKKLSDFFIQQKLNRFEKESVLLLVNGNGEVIWVMGHRLDNRYKVTENTKKVLTLVLK